MEKKKVHFVGIGGISMSGIAEILLGKGYHVSGSDQKDSHLLDKLKDLGAEIYIGHHPGNIKDAEVLVVSSAISETNPELKYARKKGLKIMKRAEMIAELMKGLRGIAVAGTHGKTTTTSMTASVLLEGGADPTILLGGELDIIGGNSYSGKGGFLLTEADESDGSFLYYDPEIIVITNIEMDHHDYYSSEEKLMETFRKFLERLPEEGKAVVCAEDDNLMSLVDKKDKRVLSYGIGKGKIQALDYQLFPFGSIYTLAAEGQELARINLKTPGRHNILNSLAAATVGLETGMSIQSIKRGLENYNGVRRRFEKKGLLGDILVVDDYAHHPTEIEATLKVAKNTGYERVIAVFQPHRYSRTQHLFNEFLDCFEGVAHLIITDIYSAGEKPIAGVDSEKLARQIARKNKFPVDYIARREDLVLYLEKIAKNRDLIITLGAGDVYKIGEMFIANWKKKAREMA